MPEKKKKPRLEIKEFQDKKKFMDEIVSLKKQDWHLVSLVPWLKNKGRQLIVLYVFSLPGKLRTLSIKLDEKHPHMESILEVYPTVNSFELEAKELFGIWFDGNPNMSKRLFLPEDFKAIPFKGGSKKCTKAI